MVDKRYVFIGLSFKQLISPDATLTGIVRRILSAIIQFWKSVDRFDCAKNCKMCSESFCTDCRIIGSKEYIT